MSAPKRIAYGWGMNGHTARWLEGPCPTVIAETEYIRADIADEMLEVLKAIDACLDCTSDREIGEVWNDVAAAIAKAQDKE